MRVEHESALDGFGSSDWSAKGRAARDEAGHEPELSGSEPTLARKTLSCPAVAEFRSDAPPFTLRRYTPL